MPRGAKKIERRISLEDIYKRVNGELNFNIVAFTIGYAKEDIIAFYKEKMKALTPLERRRAKRRKMQDVVYHLNDERSFEWIAKRLFVTKQNVYLTYERAKRKGLISKMFKSRMIFK